jgi:hypothetical protein
VAFSSQYLTPKLVEFRIEKLNHFEIKNLTCLTTNIKTAFNKFFKVAKFDEFKSTKLTFAEFDSPHTIFLSTIWLTSHEVNAANGQALIINLIKR